MFKSVLREFLRLLMPTPKVQAHPEFGGSGITEECFRWITSNIASGANILEFGAGLVSTPKLSQHFRLTSVEHNEKYIGAFNSNYIHAPLSQNTGWYEIDKVKDLENIAFELAIVDGPPGSGNRFGILLNTQILKKCKIILVDDTDRSSEKLLVELLSRALNRPYRDHGHFAVIENFE